MRKACTWCSVQRGPSPCVCTSMVCTCAAAEDGHGPRDHEQHHRMEGWLQQQARKRAGTMGSNSCRPPLPHTSVAIPMREASRSTVRLPSGSAMPSSRAAAGAAGMSVGRKAPFCCSHSGVSWAGGRLRAPVVRYPPKLSSSLCSARKSVPRASAKAGQRDGAAEGGNEWWQAGGARRGAGCYRRQAAAAAGGGRLPAPRLRSLKSAAASRR